MTDLDRLVDGYLADDLSVAERDELVALLRDGSDRAREFVRELDWRAQLAEASGQVRSATAEFAACDAPTPRPRHRRLVTVVAGAAAVAAALILALWPESAAVPPADGWDGPMVARVMRLMNTQATESPVIKDQAFLAGESLHLDAGAAVIEMADGTKLMLEEQTTVIFDAPRQVYLKRGRISVRIGPYSDGFEVVTPTTRVVDHGTEFGVLIAEDGATDTHVFEGSVSVGEAGSAKLDRVVYAGSAVRAAADSGLRSIELQPELFRSQDVFYPVAIHNTGDDLDGKRDLHWQMRLPNSEEWLPTVLIEPLKMVRPSDASSSWIAGPERWLPDDQIYPFRTTFEVRAPGPVELRLKARLMADDMLTEARLDGETVWRPSAAQLAVREPWGREFVEVVISRTVEPGWHSLEFDTRNYLRSAGKRDDNDTGFRAEFDAVLVRRGQSF